MSDSTLLLPDTGPDFLRALNLAALYSDRVHVFTLTSAAEAERLDALLAMGELWVATQISTEEQLRQLFYESEGEAGVDSEGDSLRPNDGAPFFGFLDFAIKNEAVLSLAKREGVIHSITEECISAITSKSDRSAAGMAFISSSLSAMKQPANEYKLIPPASLSSAALDTTSLPSIIEFLAYLTVALSKVKGGLPTDVIEKLIDQSFSLQHAATGTYFMLAAIYSLSTGSGTVTWQPPVQEYFEACSRLVQSGMDSTNELLVYRDSAAKRLGQMTLMEEVPNVADLPFEEVLEIRRKRQPELIAFREGLRQLVAEIDPSLDAKELELALHSKIDGLFKPAMREMRSSIEESRRRFVSDLLHPRDIGSVLIPAVFSLAAGSSLELAAVTGTIGGVLTKAYEYFVGRALAEKTLCQNTWSLLLHLEDRVGKQ